MILRLLYLLLGAALMLALIGERSQHVPSPPACYQPEELELLATRVYVCEAQQRLNERWILRLKQYMQASEKGVDFE